MYFTQVISPPKNFNNDNAETVMDIKELFCDYSIVNVSCVIMGKLMKRMSAKSSMT